MGGLGLGILPEIGRALLQLAVQHSVYYVHIVQDIISKRAWQIDKMKT